MLACPVMEMKLLPVVSKVGDRFHVGVIRGSEDTLATEISSKGRSADFRELVSSDDNVAIALVEGDSRARSPYKMKLKVV